MRAVGILIGALLAASFAGAQSPGDARAAARGAFDIVVENGRVIDPETGLDGIRSVGIRDGRIAAISRTPLRGRTVLDAKWARRRAGIHRPARARPGPAGGAHAGV